MTAPAIGASIRSQIISTAVSLLNTNTPANVPLADRSRFEPYQSADLPSINVLPVREEDEKKDGRWGYLLTRGMTLRVECRVEGDPADELLDPLVTWAGKCLGAQQFGRLAEECIETLTEWSYAGADQNYSMCAVDFRVTFSTLSNDPTSTGST